MNPRIAAAASALFFAMAGANATVLGPLDLSSGSAGFSNTPDAGAFTDTFTFTITARSIANASVTAVVNGNQDVDFSSISISGPSGSFAFSLLNADPVELWALPAAGSLLDVGQYTLALVGTNTANRGSYGGNIAVTPTVAIPEPEIYALLLAGLGVVGFTAQRRKGR